MDSGTEYASRGLNHPLALQDVHQRSCAQEQFCRDYRCPRGILKQDTTLGQADVETVLTSPEGRRASEVKPQTCERSPCGSQSDTRRSQEPRSGSAVCRAASDSGHGGTGAPAGPAGPAEGSSPPPAPRRRPPRPRPRPGPPLVAPRSYPAFPREAKGCRIKGAAYTEHGNPGRDALDAPLRGYRFHADGVFPRQECRC